MELHIQHAWLELTVREVGKGLNWLVRGEAEHSEVARLYSILYCMLSSMWLFLMF